MKLGYSTWGMPAVEMDEAVPHLASLGYDGIEITVIPGYTTELSTLDAEERRRIRSLFAKHDVEMPAVAGHTSLLDPDTRQHAANMKRLKETVELCADLTMGNLVPCLDTTPGGKPEDWPDVRDRLLNEVGDLVDFGAQHGVVIAMEPHIGCCLCDVETDPVAARADRLAVPETQLRYQPFRRGGSTYLGKRGGPGAPHHTHPREGPAGNGAGLRVPDSRRGRFRLRGVPGRHEGGGIRRLHHRWK